MKKKGIQKVRGSEHVYLPKVGFVRLFTVLMLIPVSKSTWWEGVRTGRYPPAIKLGPRTTVWRAEHVRALIDNPDRGFGDEQKAREAVTA